MNFARIASLVGAAFLVASCASEERPVIVESNPRSLPEVHSPAGSAVEAIKVYDYEQRDLIVNNLQHVLADLDGRIIDLRARSKTIAADSREEWNETLTELEHTRDELEVGVARIKFATTDTWDDTKDSVVEGLEEVQDLLENLHDTIRD